MWQRRRALAGGGEQRADDGDVLLQRLEAREHVAVVAEIRREQAHDRLVLDARQRRRLGEPRPERRETLVGQLVPRAGGGAARLLARAKVAQPLEALRLRVPVALGRRLVETALRPDHPDEVVIAAAAAAQGMELLGPPGALPDAR